MCLRSSGSVLSGTAYPLGLTSAAMRFDAQPARPPVVANQSPKNAGRPGIADLGLSLSRIWDIVIRDLPVLRAVVAKVLSNPDATGPGDSAIPQ